MLYLLWTYHEETHVPDEEQNLVEADVLVCLFFSFLPFVGSSSLDVPDPYRTFLELGLDSGFLIDSLKKSSLPPLYFHPYSMRTDQFLQLYFSIILNEIVSQGKNHQHQT